MIIIIIQSAWVLLSCIEAACVYVRLPHLPLLQSPPGLAAEPGALAQAQRRAQVCQTSLIPAHMLHKVYKYVQKSGGSPNCPFTHA